MAMFPYTTLLFKYLQDLYRNDNSSGLIYKLIVTILLVTSMLGLTVLVDLIIFIATIFFRLSK